MSQETSAAGKKGVGVGVGVIVVVLLLLVVGAFVWQRRNQLQSNGGMLVQTPSHMQVVENAMYTQANPAASGSAKLPAANLPTVKLTANILYESGGVAAESVQYETVDENVDVGKNNRDGSVEANVSSNAYQETSAHVNGEVPAVALTPNVIYQSAEQTNNTYDTDTSTSTFQLPAVYETVDEQTSNTYDTDTRTSTFQLPAVYETVDEQIANTFC